MPTPSILVSPRRVNNSWPAWLTTAEESPSVCTPLSLHLFTPHQILYSPSLSSMDPRRVYGSYVKSLWLHTCLRRELGLSTSCKSCLSFRSRCRHLHYRSCLRKYRTCCAWVDRKMCRTDNGNKFDKCTKRMYENHFRQWKYYLYSNYSAEIEQNTSDKEDHREEG